MQGKLKVVKKMGSLQAKKIAQRLKAKATADALVAKAKAKSGAAVPIAAPEPDVADILAIVEAGIVEAEITPVQPKLNQICRVLDDSKLK